MRGVSEPPADDELDERAARWIPYVLDAGVFVLIAIAIFVTHYRVIAHGFCFNDPSWYFHFGKRLVDGAVPYRDYVFQVGPLPIYVDAFFQKTFGSTYVASLYAGMATKIVRMYVVWLIARELAGTRAASILLVFCTFEPIFAFSYHWSTPYAQLFLTLSGYFFVLAARAKEPPRRTMVWLALAGVSAAWVFSARQSTGVVITLVVFAVTAAMAARKEFFTRARFASLWGGFAGGLLALGAWLAAAGALRPAIKQLFLDAPAKKAIHGIDALLDAVSGGALIHYQGDPAFSWWSGLFAFIGLPALVIAAGIFVLSRKDDDAALRTLAMLGIPLAMLLGMLTRYATFEVLSDLPRTFFTVTTVLAVVWPDRLRKWFGIEPVVAVGLGTFPLASDWAMEMSNPGRGWGDAPSLTIGAVLFWLALRRFQERVKIAIASSLAFVGVVYLVMCFRADLNPFAKNDSADGTLKDNTFESDHPMLRGLLVSEARKKTLDWLTSNVKPGSTCFVYGNLPVLYSLLDCKNPTVIDSTAADFITAADAEAAIAALRASPPEFLIAHEKSWMNPPLWLDYQGQLDRYEGMNPKASRAIHVGLRDTLAQYESIGLVSEILGPELTAKANVQRDIINATRLYRRKK